MSVAPLSYRWSPSEFIRAWEAGAFDRRVELVEGEVWPVVIGSWHGRTQMRLATALPRAGAELTSATLPSGDSLPDPDCWVLRAGAKPIGTVGARVEVWDAADVLLVVEVSDDSMLADLNTKAKVYGQSGYPVYWVVTRDAVYEHTSPSPEGYRTRTEYRRGERVPVAYAGTDLGVTDLVGPDDE
jgi:hypothetical protein